MLGEIRQQEIVNLTTEHKSVNIRELAQIFSVSEETIRRDLKKLEHDGKLRRTHGGALFNENVHFVPPIDQRNRENIEAKQAIANKAAEFVSDRMTVMLDSGSTTLEIARRIANMNITVLTNDLTIAMELGPSQVQLIVLGGIQQKGTYTLTGHECEEAIQRYHVDLVFIGTGGIGLKQGLTTSSSAESELKRLMIQAGSQVYCVADRFKVGNAALISFAGVPEVDAIITDAEEQNPILNQLRHLGANFLLV